MFSSCQNQNMSGLHKTMPDLGVMAHDREIAHLVAPACQSESRVRILVVRARLSVLRNCLLLF